MSISYLPTYAPSNRLAQWGERILFGNGKSSTRRHRLKDGQRILMKPIGPKDASAIVEIFSGLGPESSYLRFGQHNFRHSSERMQKISQQIAMEATGNGRGWIAYGWQSGGQLDPIGKARYVTLPDQQAEVAFTIKDDYQGLGLGTLLWGKVVRGAKEAKLSNIVAKVHPQNYRMQALVYKSELYVSTEHESQMLSMSVSLGGY